MRRIAWIASGQLYLRAPDGLISAVHSPFLERVHETAARMAERRAWKESGASGAVLNRPEAPGPAATFAAVCSGDGPLRYALDTGAVGGLFTVEPDGDELRLFHTERFRIRSLAAGPDGGLLASVGVGAASHLARFAADGATPRDLTDGDAVDLHPHLSPDGAAVLYQSAGLARDPHHAGHIAPFEILRLDLRTGTLTVVAADADRDLLQPKWGADGAIWWLRAPPRPAGPTFTEQLIAVITWPVRVLAGLVTVLSALARLSQLPDATADGRAGDDLLRRLLLPGATAAPAAAALTVPRASDAWELVRQRPGGAPEVVARRVIAWDLADDGALLLTDGRTITVQRPDGGREDVATGAQILSVAWV